MFKKILVANRGEIAVRLLRACREMNICSVAVYSDADRNALHTRYADELYYLGPAPAVDSYLKIGKIIEIARRAKAEAIHPGYGFLAENAEFARACEASGIAFIGPNSHAIGLLGDKIVSKKTMAEAGIPVIPGSAGAIDREGAAVKVIKNIGLPVLVKAAGGGGGKGMRVVSEIKDLGKAMKAAMNEARSAFGNPTIFIERFLETPRHIEFQILADNHGNVIHLYERECSVQRRYQKLIEESPSTLLTPALRSQMGAAAVKAVKAAHYTNAGTVEFMVDKQCNFYFLEMNTRLQVEHPVTELVTGVDIVKEQFNIASGGNLGLKQDDIKMNGAAIECRISAEDPENNFAPSTGKIEELIEPGGIGVRVDSGIYDGFEVPIYYDPLISKLLVWAPTRKEAILRMGRALAEYTIRGIRTSIPFHQLVMEHPRFISGEYDTTFADEVLHKVQYIKSDHEVAAIASVLGEFVKKRQAIVSGEKKISAVSSWKMAGRQTLMRGLRWPT